MSDLETAAKRSGASEVELRLALESFLQSNAHRGEAARVLANATGVVFLVSVSALLPGVFGLVEGVLLLVGCFVGALLSGFLAGALFAYWRLSYDIEHITLSEVEQRTSD